MFMIRRHAMQQKTQQLKQAGITLVEVLVSLAILAIGLLSMTLLQNEALGFNYAAFTDSQAQFLVNDMIERIRANPGSDDYRIQFIEVPSAPPVNCAAATCTPNQMALWDLSQWRASVEDSALLPDGQSQIIFDTNTRSFTISISYDWSQLGGVDIANGRRTVSVSTRIDE